MANPVDRATAVFRGGSMSRDLGQLAGKELTVLVRMRLSKTEGEAPIASIGTAAEPAAFRLFAADIDAVRMLCLDVHFDWQNPRNNRPLRLTVPMAMIGLNRTADVVFRSKHAKAELLVDGVLVDEEWPVGGVRMPANPVVDVDKGAGVEQVALWNGWLPDDEVAAISGGAEKAARREIEVLGPPKKTLNYWKPRGHNTSVGDCMPFFHDGRFHLFYLFDRRHHGSKWGLGAHQWAHASTTDLVYWEHHPLAVPVTREWEGSICTGSTFFHDGVYYAFYSARKHDGTPGELTASTSSDGVHFTKHDPLFTLRAPYEPVSARDPNVFHDTETGLFHMLVTTEVLSPPAAYRGGCLAHMVSRDLRTWEQEEPFIVPGLCGQPECPNLFSWNGWHYLFVGLDGVTRYRMSRSLFGPWLRPRMDLFDSPQSYVMKTAAFTGNRRIGVAWVGQHGWGGHAVFREILQNADGTLGSAWVPEMIPPSGDAIQAVPQPLAGDVSCAGNRVSIRAAYGFGAAAVRGVPGNVRLRLRVVPAPNSAAFGIAVRGWGNYAQGCELRIEPDRRKVGWRPCVSSTAEECERNAIYDVDGLDRPFMLDIVVKDDLLDVCVDGRRTLVVRAWPPCDRFSRVPGEGDGIFFFAHCGAISFEDIEMRPLPDDIDSEFRRIAADARKKLGRA